MKDEASLCISDSPVFVSFLPYSPKKTEDSTRSVSYPLFFIANPPAYAFCKMPATICLNDFPDRLRLYFPALLTCAYVTCQS